MRKGLFLYPSAIARHLHLKNVMHKQTPSADVPLCVSSLKKGLYINDFADLPICHMISVGVLTTAQKRKSEKSSQC